jgi:hypothetical protein
MLRKPQKFGYSLTAGKSCGYYLYFLDTLESSKLQGLCVKNIKYSGGGRGLRCQIQAAAGRAGLPENRRSGHHAVRH